MAPLRPLAIGHPIRFIPEWNHDPYLIRRKWSEPSWCPSCGASYENGRWVWAVHKATGASEKICPACQRIRDSYPAGYLTLRGAFVMAHRREIEALIHHVVEREKKEHPLKRLMRCGVDSEGGLEATFTEPHLAAQVGQQIQRAYDGDLSTQYEQGEYLVRVHWERNGSQVHPLGDL